MKPRALTGLLFLWAIAFAQGDDVLTRLRRVLPGDRERVADLLAHRQFAEIEALLVKSASTDAAERRERMALRGAVAFLGGRMSDAISDFEQAEAISPLGEGDRFTLAMALVKSGDDGRAAQRLSDLSRSHPEQMLYVYWLGRIDYDQRRYDEAVTKLTKAVSLDPNSARAWDNLGLASDMQGKPDLALDAFRKATLLNRQSAHPSAWPPHNLGHLLLRLDRSEEAEAVLRESLKYDSDLAQSHYHLGRALEKQGRNGEAVNEYKAAIKDDLSSTDACYSLAMLYRKMQREEDAKKIFAEYRRRHESVRIQQ